MSFELKNADPLPSNENLLNRIKPSIKLPNSYLPISKIDGQELIRSPLSHAGILEDS